MSVNAISMLTGNQYLGNKLKQQRRKRNNQLEKQKKQNIQECKHQGGVSIGKYRDNCNGTVTDATTGLMWMRCSMGKRWDGGTCIGDIKEYTWRSTNNLSAKFAGYSDWRVPTIRELNTLVYCSNGKKLAYKKGTWDTRKSEGFYGCKSDGRGDYQRPTINQRAFPNMYAGNFWSSSPFTGYSDYAWILFFDDGYDSNYLRRSSNGVRLLRNP